ncbi:MAG: glycosyltransferase family A protein [Candidatus Pacearchaeota archaeon]
MKVAIIIPTKNEEKYLPILLDSLKKQTFKKFKIYVADAKSKDKTRKIAKSYGCIVVEGGLPSVGRDNAARIAIKDGADILVFIDADVVLPTIDFMDKALNEFKNKKLDLATARIKPIFLGRKDKGLLIMEIRLLYFIYNIIIILFQRTKRPFMQNYMISRSIVHKKINGFGKMEFGEDSEYCKKAVLFGYNFRILNSPGKIFLYPRRFIDNGFWKILFILLFLNLRIILGYKPLIKKKRLYFK